MLLFTYCVPLHRVTISWLCVCYWLASICWERCGTWCVWVQREIWVTGKISAALQAYFYFWADFQHTFKNSEGKKKKSRNATQKGQNSLTAFIMFKVKITVCVWVCGCVCGCESVCAFAAISFFLTAVPETTKKHISRLAITRQRWELRVPSNSKCSLGSRSCMKHETDIWNNLQIYIRTSLNVISLFPSGGRWQLKWSAFSLWTKKTTAKRAKWKE